MKLFEFGVAVKMLVPAGKEADAESVAVEAAKSLRSALRRFGRRKQLLGGTVSEPSKPRALEVSRSTLEAMVSQQEMFEGDAGGDGEGGNGDGGENAEGR